jgi:hypothetical protein
MADRRDARPPGELKGAESECRNSGLVRVLFDHDRLLRRSLILINAFAAARSTVDHRSKGGFGC